LFALQFLLEPAQGPLDRLSSSEFNFRHIQELTCSAAACGKALCPLWLWCGNLGTEFRPPPSCAAHTLATRANEGKYRLGVMNIHFVPQLAAFREAIRVKVCQVDRQ
jgi:hypothetical protein